MSDSFLDRLPSREREKIRKRMRSAAEYERLRERVKGPQDLERELGRQERMAQLAFRLETEPVFREKAKSAVERLIAERGIDAVLEADDAEADAIDAIERGAYTVTLGEHPATHLEQMAVLLEGNVREKIPLTRALSDQCAAQLLSGE